MLVIHITPIYIYKQRLPFRLSRATRKPQIGRSLRQLRLLQRAKLARVPKSFASNRLFQPSRQSRNYTTFTSDLVCASYKIISRELSRTGSWIMNNNREQISDKLYSVPLTLLINLSNIANSHIYKTLLHLLDLSSINVIVSLKQGMTNRYCT